MKDYIKLMRISHYLKNILIFLPLIFSGHLVNLNELLVCIVGFISFSLLASAVYIINDLKDIEIDKLHSVKKNRPIASGRITKKEALVLLIVLICVSFLLQFLLPVSQNICISILLSFSYLFINILYSFGLKNIPILDVSILSLGFIIRVLYGARLIDIDVSEWLYLIIMVGSFFMGFGKRRNEIIKQGTESRNVLKKYNKNFLDKFMYVCVTLILIFYSLWAIDDETIMRIGNNYMIYTVPLVLIILMEYSFNIEGDSQGDPVDVLLKDKILLSLVILFAVIMLIILYII